jgi:AMP deaminase
VIEAQALKSKTALPGSPIPSLQTNPSAANLQDQAQGFSELPPGAIRGSPVYAAQQARIPADAGTQNQPTSPTRMKHDGQFARIRHSPSMTLDLGSGAPPQPGAGGLSQSSSQQTLSMYANPSVFSPDESLGPWTSSSAGLTIDGIEPRIFPGVVSKRRRSSLRSSTLEDGEGNQQAQAQHPGHSGFRRGNEGSVVEEHDTDDDE